MCSLGKTLLIAFAQLHSLLQGQICLLFHLSLDFLLLLIGTLGYAAIRKELKELVFYNESKDDGEEEESSEEEAEQEEENEEEEEGDNEEEKKEK